MAGKAHREGISLIELMDMFPDDATAEAWFVNRRWPNGIESLWSTLKRAHKGTFHKISPKHLDRYVQEFAGRHNLRDENTIDIMAAIARHRGRGRLTERRLRRVCCEGLREPCEWGPNG